MSDDEKKVDTSGFEDVKTGAPEAGPGFDADDAIEIVPGSAGAVSDEEPGGNVVTFVGIKNWRGAQPAFHTIVIPPKDHESRTDKDPGGYAGVHSEGRTYQFTRGVAKRVAPDDAKWLTKHPTLEFAASK